MECLTHPILTHQDTNKLIGVSTLFKNLGLYMSPRAIRSVVFSGCALAVLGPRAGRQAQGRRPPLRLCGPSIASVV